MSERPGRAGSVASVTTASLFASQELVARIEAAECGLLRDAVGAVSASRPATDVLRLSVGGGVATWAGPASPLNKVAGLGFAGPVTDEAMDEVEARFAGRGSPVQVELATLADPAVGAALTARGYRLVGFENVLGRALASGGIGADPSGHGDAADAPAAEADAPTDVRVDRSDEQGFSTWLDAVVTGFLHPDGDGLPPHEAFSRETLERVIGDLAGADGFLQYIAHVRGEPAGGASMRIDRGVAQLAGAATLPAHRRRGVQAALLARRLADARSAGCDVAVITTQPGSASQRNAQRKGFALLYARAVLVLDPAARPGPNRSDAEA